ncbi:MAG: SgcJ/EcaC family oxidoreductase [Acidobacteriia bacterium]|nr:SgcJ/EcaC family oxidoreductase [Terriglobia bacterium]
MRLLRIFAAMAMALGLFPSLSAFPAQNSPMGAEADTAAIKQVFTDFYESFTRHDAHATAMTFAADGDFTNMRGVHRRGRKDIEAWFASLFAGNLKDSHRTDIVRSIRFFTPDVATVDADTTITGTKAADGTEVPPRKGLMIATLTRQDGRWVISTFHEAEFPESRPASPDRPLRTPTNP